MLPNEQKVLEEMKTVHNKYFVPLVWTTSLVTRARKEGRIKDDYAVKTLIDVCIPIHPDFMFSKNTHRCMYSYSYRLFCLSV